MMVVKPHWLLLCLLPSLHLATATSEPRFGPVTVQFFGASSEGIGSGLADTSRLSSGAIPVSLVKDVVRNDVGLPPQSQDGITLVQTINSAYPLSRPLLSLISIVEKDGFQKRRGETPMFSVASKCDLGSSSSAECLLSEMTQSLASSLHHQSLQLEKGPTVSSWFASEEQSPSASEMAAEANALLDVLKSDEFTTALPSTLTEIISIHVEETNVSVQMFGRQMIASSISDTCLRIFFAELIIVETTIQACMKSAEEGDAPLVCAVTPTDAAECWKSENINTANAEMASHLLEAIVNRFSTTHQDVLTMSLTLPLYPSKKSFSSDFTVLPVKKHVSMEEESITARRLQDEDVSTVSDSQATHVQITMWTTIAAAIAAIWGFYATMSMTNERDPLLFSKVNTSRA